ncbi:hypothetical protein M413DRAFT_439716 [Hebeloma cylindrosporum]|uniref:TPR-like protein n=1 Tax=Hebeloma cylindrosporum TaxID=76867 RepID=A0A0C2Z458_HEBCY|nr:hypothetical protein M413DRAFT_439716 [Hebeloma cylindrosporum h7]
MPTQDSPSSPEEEVLEKNYLDIANERKQEGNDCFRAGKWNEALTAYRSALNSLPKRPTKPRPDVSEQDEIPGEDPSTKKGSDDEGEKEEAVVDVSSPAVTESEKESVRLRSVLNANIGACFVKLGDHKEAVQACTQAILDDPTYIKALERRAASNDILNTWTSLTSVQEDYNTLLKLYTSPTQLNETRRKLQYLKPRLEAAQKRETDEMLGKLKGLGNSILGNFGLSTDNFKFEPNGSGGYSMNFSR